MPNPYRYRAVINRLASLADAPNPGHVQVAAAATLARELSPANPRRALIQQMLHAVDAFEYARHKLRDLYDHAAPATDLVAPRAACPALDAGAGADLQDDESLEEDDDPL